MGQLDNENGVDMNPDLVDYLLKKKDPNYQGGATKALDPTNVAQMLSELQARRRAGNSPEYHDLEQQKEPSFDPEMMAGMAKSLNQMGTVGGKASDMSGLDQFAGAMAKQQGQRQAVDRLDQTRNDKLDQEEMTNASKAAELGNTASRNATEDRYRTDQLGIQNQHLDLQKQELAHKQSVDWAKHGLDRDALVKTWQPGVDENGNPGKWAYNARAEKIRFEPNGKASPLTKQQAQDKEVADNYAALKEKVANIRQSVATHGLFNPAPFSGEGGLQDQDIFNSAILYDKIANPGATVRHSTLEMTKKYGLPIRDTIGPGVPKYTKAQALALIDNYERGIDDIIKNRIKGRSLEEARDYTPIARGDKPVAQSGVAQAAPRQPQAQSSSGVLPEITLPQRTAPKRTFQKGESWTNPKDGKKYVSDGTQLWPEK